MKTKILLSLVTISLLLAVFMNTDLVDKKLDYSAKSTMNIVKCSSTDFLLKGVDTTRQISPLFENLGNYNYTISTKSEKAQIFFNQGLNLTYAFNHAEAHRSFMEASRLDPKSAMPYWGQAYVLGPNINDQLPDKERREKSFEALQKALQLSASSSQKEQDIIHALSFRYAKDSVDVSDLNYAYMVKMEKVAKKYPKDVDILTLYAASVMNTVPWNYWDKDGNPSANIKKAKLALENAIELSQNHAGANHYYIHMVELPKPELGVPSAEKLESIMPGAGHLVHMPSHIYMRVGRYNDAVRVNQKAILVDEDYISQCYSQGMYPLGYYPHNIHFLWSAASMAGQSRIAIDAAKKTAEKIPIGELSELPFLQVFAVTPLLAYLRFGKWNEILTIPNPGDEYTHLKLFWNYARGIAFVKKNNLKEAQEELEFLENRDKSLAQEVLAKVAYEVLAGEIEALKGNFTLSTNHFEMAMKYEDELPYNEPAEWYIPTRQSYGAILLKSKEYEKAEKIFNEDLLYYPNNGWSLMGLYQSLKGLNKIEEAELIKEKFDEVWSTSDILITSSVL